MGEIEKVTSELFGWRCDRRGCPQQWLLAEPVNGFSFSREFIGAQLAAMADGWSFWVSRARRVYCPDHGPTPGTKLWQVSPDSLRRHAGAVKGAAGPG